LRDFVLGDNSSALTKGVRS